MVSHLLQSKGKIKCDDKEKMDKYTYVEEIIAKVK
jgi:hypothetical protein